MVGLLGKMIKTKSPSLLEVADVLPWITWNEEIVRLSKQVQQIQQPLSYSSLKPQRNIHNCTDIMLHTGADRWWEGWGRHLEKLVLSV